MFKSFSLAVVGIAVLLFCSPALCQPENQNGTVKLLSGSVNDYSVQDSSLEVFVGPGGYLSGTLLVEADNYLSPSAIVPLIVVWNWGDHASAYQTINSWIPHGVSDYSVSIGVTAPADTGVYYVTIAHSGELNGGQVASLTNWPVGYLHWNDGADIADFNSGDYDTSRVEHAALTLYEFATGYNPWWVPAAMIRVTVCDTCPTPPPPPPNGTVTLLSGSINGVPVQSNILELSALPGESLTGTISLDANNRHDGSAVVPLVMVWNWGEHQNSFNTVAGWIPVGHSSFNVPVSLTAPSPVGTYYITFAFSGEMNGGQVASLTNWPIGALHWNDGVDVADWEQAQYDTSLLIHAAWTPYELSTGFTDFLMPAAMIKITVTGTSTPKSEASALANDFAVFQNFPNPFNPATTIEYRLPQTSRVVLSVYDILGRNVLQKDIGTQTAGRHSINIDSSDWAAGTYFYQVDCGKQAITRRMTLVK